MLLPAFCVPRRRDGAEVIGTALDAKAQGEGYRPIAARLNRPPATVRGWLCAATRHSEGVLEMLFSAFLGGPWFRSAWWCEVVLLADLLLRLLDQIEARLSSTP